MSLHRTLSYELLACSECGEDSNCLLQLDCRQVWAEPREMLWSVLCETHEWAFPRVCVLLEGRGARGHCCREGKGDSGARLVSRLLQGHGDKDVRVHPVFVPILS